MKTVNSAFKFHGGVHPQYNKDLAASKPIEAMPLPKQLVVSMSQHLGAPAKCLVKKGDAVVKGQLIGEKGGFISANVHASACGTVKSVELKQGAAGGYANAVVLETESSDETAYMPPLDWKTATKEELLKRVEDAGICGMGGAYISLINGGGVWNNGCVNGQGWIAVALVIFASWSPAKAILGSLVFGMFMELQIRANDFAYEFPFLGFLT